MKKKSLYTRIRGKKYMTILSVGVISTFKPYLGINLAYGIRETPNLLIRGSKIVYTIYYILYTIFILHHIHSMLFHLKNASSR